EPRELARRVRRRTVVCGEHLARNLSNPPRPAIESTAGPVDQRTLVPHPGQERVRQATGQIGACARVVHLLIIATSRADGTPSCLPGPASNRRSRGLAMRWHGHEGVPGVAPERDQRPTARLPTSVTQRRAARRYRTRNARAAPAVPLCVLVLQRVG